MKVSGDHDIDILGDEGVEGPGDGGDIASWGGESGGSSNLKVAFAGWIVS